MRPRCDDSRIASALHSTPSTLGGPGRLICTFARETRQGIIIIIVQPKSIASSTTVAAHSAPAKARKLTFRYLMGGRCTADAHPLSHPTLSIIPRQLSPPYICHPLSTPSSVTLSCDGTPTHSFIQHVEDFSIVIVIAVVILCDLQ